jgi:DNA repair exonuclease SbcCD ATPase subunit
MAQSQQFLEDFQLKMDRLAQIRRDLQASVQFKEQFTNDLKVRLGDINNKISQLSGLINELKNKATDLETRVNTNVASIDAKDSELQQLKDQITALTNEKDTLASTLKQQQDATNTEMARLQGLIDKSETKLREVTQQKEVASNELQALQTELQSKGDQQSAHAEAIKQLTEQSQKSLQDQEVLLMKKITESDEKIAQLEKQISDKENQLIEQQKAIEVATGQAQTSAQGLQQQIDDLKVENQGLIDRIVAATQAINEANDELQNIVDTVPNAKTKEEVDALLNEITQQIDLSIVNIGRATQGQDQRLPPPPTNIDSTLLPPRPPAIDPDTKITFKDGTSLKFGDILKMLQTKVEQTKGLRSKVDGSDASIRYRKALKVLRELSDVSQVPDALQQSGVTVKNDKIMGGRRTRKITKITKTRKNRKQKGGFLYKSSTKRKSIRSSRVRNL